LAAGGTVSDLYTVIVDGCRSGSFDDFLFPDAAPIGSGGGWSHRAGEIAKQPTTYHGKLTGDQASGTISDTAANRAGAICRGRTRFTAARSSPLTITAATIGARGTDVTLQLALPPASQGKLFVPYTSTALLVYATNAARCPNDYRQAGRLARRVNHSGYTGLITDRYVDRAFESLPYRAAPRAYRLGVFTFHVATNTILPTADRRSPFAAVCATLYKGRPAGRSPGSDIAVQTTRSRLVFGAGIPTAPKP
jgi:hypothetical protein